MYTIIHVYPTFQLITFCEVCWDVVSQPSMLQVAVGRNSRLVKIFQSIKSHGIWIRGAKWGRRGGSKRTEMLTTIPPHNSDVRKRSHPAWL